MSKIMDILSEGKENALTAQDISRILGYDNVRVVAAEIARLRQQGKIICSINGEHNGYYLPESDEDIVKFVVKTERRIQEITKALQPAKNYLEGLEK